MLRCPEPPRFFAIVHARLLRAVLKTYGQTVPSFSACRSPRSLALPSLPSFLPSFEMRANAFNAGNDYTFALAKRERKRKRERESGKSSIINRSWRGAPATSAYYSEPASCPPIEIADEKTCTSYTRIDFFGKSVRSSTNWRSCSMTDLSVARREKRPPRTNGAPPPRPLASPTLFQFRRRSRRSTVFSRRHGERGEREVGEIPTFPPTNRATGFKVDPKETLLPNEEGRGGGGGRGRGAKTRA